MIVAARARAQTSTAHLDFIANQFVDQAAVKALLLEGKSQAEVAKLLGMSKRTVNTHARSPYRSYAAAKLTDHRQMELDRHVDDAFLVAVWGSPGNAEAARRLCTRYDRERLDIESDT